MEFASALLEDWMRSYYFSATIDLGSSGVADFSLGEICDLTGVDIADLRKVVFSDSPSLGREDLRAAISHRWGNGDPDWALTTHGASEAIYVTMMTLLNPGDEVVALQPTYHSHSSIAESLGCKVSYWVLRAEQNFMPDLTDLATIVAKKRPKVIVVNFPHNPTGVTLDEAQLGTLIEIADGGDAHLVWDAAFSELVYDSSPLRDPITRYPKAVSIGTLSKAFGLPGLRFGWCLAKPDLISNIVKLRDRMTLSLSPLLEFLAYQAITHADALLGARLPLARMNRLVLAQWSQEHRDYVDLVVPRGGVTAFPLLQRCSDTRPLCQRLGDEHGVLLVPGVAFGHPERVRLGFGASPEKFEKGLDVLSTALVEDAEKGA